MHKRLPARGHKKQKERIFQMDKKNDQITEFIAIQQNDIQ